MTRLSPGGGEVWWVDLDGPDHGDVAEAARHHLSRAEQERAARFRRPDDGRRWVVARMALRGIVAGHLGVAVADVDWVLGPKDKPAVAGQGPQGLRCNLSHSAGLGLVAVAQGREVGVDVERIRDELDVVALAARALGPQEADALAALEPGDRAAPFFARWVRHEATLKCLGTGLTGGPPPTGGPGVEELETADLPAPSGWAAAVVVAPPVGAGEGGRWWLDPPGWWPWEPEAGFSR